MWIEKLKYRGTCIVVNEDGDPRKLAVYTTPFREIRVRSPYEKEGGFRNPTSYEIPKIRGFLEQITYTNYLFCEEISKLEKSS